MAPAKGLVTAVAIHTLIGQASDMAGLTMNSFNPLIMSMVNRSFILHYDHPPSSQGFAWLLSILTTGQEIGVVLTSLMLAFVLDRLGRKATFVILKNAAAILACFFLFLGGVVESFESFLIGRLVCGVLAAFSMAPAMVYIGECSPSVYRGAATQVFNAGTVVWRTLSVVLALPPLMGTDKAWPYVFFIPLLFSIAHVGIGLPWFPRSPKYLYLKRRNVAAAKESLQFYHGEDVDFDQVFTHFDSEANLARSDVSFRDIWKQRHLRRALVICVVSVMIPHLAGQTVAGTYTIPLLLWIGLDPAAALGALLGMQCVVIAGVLFISLYLIDRVGRRPLYFFAVVCMTIGMLSLLGAGLTNPGAVFGSATANGDQKIRGWTMFFTVVFAISALGMIISPTHIAMLLLAEICPQGARAKTTEVVILASSLLNVLVTLLVPPLLDLMGAYLFLLFAMFGGVSAVWVWYYFPETRLRDVDDVVSQWKKEEEEEKKPLLEKNSN